MKGDLKQDKAMVKGAVHKHEKAMHPGKPMTPLKNGGAATAMKRYANGGRVSPLAPVSTKNPKAFGAK